MDLYERCVDFIQRNTEDVIHSESFLEINLETLKSILECDSLTIDEETLFTHVMEWCKNKCSIKSLEVNDFNKRFVLGDAIRCIRFPIMNENYFKTAIAGLDLLQPGEVIDVFLEQFNKTPVVSSIQSTFKSKPRNFQRVKRFRKTLRDTIYSDSEDAISFECSTKVCFHGVSLYTPKDENFDQQVSVRLQNEENENIGGTTSSEFSFSKDKMYDVLLPNSVVLIPDKRYTVIVTSHYYAKGYYGLRGKDKVQFKSATVTFYDPNSSFPDNTTTVDFGQIPGLLLSCL